MPIILPIILLFLCLGWLYNSNKSSGVLVRIVFAYIGGTSIGFLIALALENQYLDGLTHLMLAGGSAILFWLVSIILILTQTKQASSGERLAKLFIVSMVVLVPLLIYLLISNMAFKIGG